ncbi:MAG: DEAD/DEAH box helicase [Candidatus Velamenicoccus archaeovorus]
MSTAASSFVPSFLDLGASTPVAEALARNGIIEPFPIQSMVLPDALDGHDVLARSQTGSGKTLAFGVPVAERTDPSAPTPSVLVLVPTRELAAQVGEDLEPIAAARGLRVAVVHGGVGARSGGPRRSGAQGGGSGRSGAKAGGNARPGLAHIVVATPGRLNDLADRGQLKLDRVRILVLDEADRMLDMGFQPQVDRIVRRLPADRQTMFFSATLDGAVSRIAAAYTRSPRRHEIDAPTRTVERVEHRFVPVSAQGKVDALVDLLGDDRDLTLVFVRTKRGADRLVGKLKARGIRAEAMHGDMTQPARQRALARFEAGKVTVLVATDVAARGLDLDRISHVVNFDPPQDDKDYVHRVGRTARAGRSGTGITLVTAEQQGDVSRMAARLELREAFQAEGMTIAPPRVVFSGSVGGRRSSLRRPRRR